MAYQPLYATIEDTNGVRSTHSCRRKVWWITNWLNSHLGEVLTYKASFLEPEPAINQDRARVIVRINVNPKARISVNQENNQLTIELKEV